MIGIPADWPSIHWASSPVNAFFLTELLYWRMPAPAAERLTRAGVALAIVAVPLAWTTSVFAEYTLPKFAALSVGAALSSVGLFLACVQGRSPVRRTPLDLSIAAGLCALVISSCISRDPLLSLLGRYNSYAYGLWPFLLYAVLFYSAAWSFQGEPLRRLLGLLLGVGSMTGAYAALQTLGLDPFLKAALPSGGRAVSTLGSPVDLGAFLVLLLPLALHWTVARSRASGLLALSAISSGVIASGSRGAWLAAAAGVLVYLGVAAKARPRAPRAALLAGLVALGVAGLSAGVLAQRARRPADSARVEVWKTAWDAFQRQPWLGSGPDTFEQVFRRHRSEAFVRSMSSTTHFQAHAHNDLLQTLATSGALGAAAYLYLLVLLWRATLARLGEPAARATAAALGAGLLALFINMKFNPVSLEVLALAAVLCAALCALTSPPPGAGPPRGRAWALPAAAALVFTAASVALAGRWLLADSNLKAALVELAGGRRESAAARVERAIALNGCENSYKIQLINGLADRINATNDVAERLRLLELGTAAAEAALRCHPNDVNSHYLAGMAAFLKAQLGFPSELAAAAGHLDAALALDPMFLPLLETRLDIARRAGDLPSQAELRARIERLEALARR